jgi:hypothetical protein
MTNDGSASSFVGGSQFRIGLMNDNGYGGTAPTPQYGVYQNATFSGVTGPNSGGGGADGFTGYMLYVPTGNQAASAWNGGGATTGTYPGMTDGDNINTSVGQFGARFNNGGGQARWLSGTGGYALAGSQNWGASGQYGNNLGWTNNPGADMYFFTITVTNLGYEQAGLSYSFVSGTQTTNGTGSPYVTQPKFEFAGTVVDYAGGATVLESTNGAFTFDSVGFYLGGNAELDEYDFTNVDVTFVPEPASMALVGFGILAGGLFIRRRKG